MRRKGNLYDIVASRANIRQAIYNAANGKRHSPEVAAVLSDIDRHVDELHAALSSCTYRHGPYTIFKKKCGVKDRVIYKASFYPDRIVHHCIVNVMQPIWLKQIIRDTYGSIPGRGVHDAVRRIKRALTNEDATRYALKLDIAKYYPSVSHDAMMAAITRKIKDRRLIELIADNVNSTQGLALGSYTSQWLGNIMLDELDHRCKEELRLRYYFRYCDDILILAADKATLRNALSYIGCQLAKIGLNVKSNYQIYPVAARGIDFLGYRFFHGYTLMRKRIIKQFKRKLNGDCEAAIAAIPSYWGWFSHADTYRFTKKYLSWTNLTTN